MIRDYRLLLLLSSEPHGLRRRELQETTVYKKNLVFLAVLANIWRVCVWRFWQKSELSIANGNLAIKTYRFPPFNALTEKVALVRELCTRLMQIVEKLDAILTKCRLICTKLGSRNVFTIIIFFGRQKVDKNSLLLFNHLLLIIKN